MNAPATDRPAILVLEDGRAFRGTAFGAEGEVFGEIVFNTGMTGYEETLTDPSYHRQIVTMSAPHIGNTGITDEDRESRRIWVAGFVIREPSPLASSWRAKRTLDEELTASGVVAIAVPGTRALVRHLRERGVMRAGVSTVGTGPEALRERVLASAPMAGADLAREASTGERYVLRPPLGRPVRHRVAVVDLGVKATTRQRMLERDCELHVLPATSTAADILGLEPDGVLYSNGPGDPAACGYAVESMRGVLAAGRPLLGICLGHQILGRALGRGTYKLGYGHRGINQPVADRRTGKVEISSHNHGFAVDAPLDGRFDTPFGPARVSHVGLNDGVVEGLELVDAPAFSVQYHPEAAPGPHDATYLFDRFCRAMEGECRATAR